LGNKTFKGILRMKIRGFILIVLLLSLTLTLSAQHQHGSSQQDMMMDCPGLMLIDGWARATSAGAPNGAAYGYVVNLGPESDTLIGGSTPAASTVEIHTMILDGDVMRMRPVEGGLEIPAMGFAELAPGGLHIMFINLVAPLEAGSILDVVLTFEKAGDIAFAIPVREFDVTMMGAAGSHSADTMKTEPPGMHGAMGNLPMTQHAMMMDEGCWTMHEGVHLLGVWARPAPEGTPTSAVYGLFINLTDGDKTLVGAETDAASAVEIHQTTVDEHDVMRMRPVEGGLVLKSGGTAHLKPAGLHMMLINPTRELIAGEDIDLVLIFDDDSTVTLTVPIVDPSAEGMAEAHTEHNHSN
jgi:copper(I)-binding protein